MKTTYNLLKDSDKVRGYARYVLRCTDDENRYYVSAIAGGVVTQVGTVLDAKKFDTVAGAENELATLITAVRVGFEIVPTSECKMIV